MVTVQTVFGAGADTADVVQRVGRVDRDEAAAGFTQSDEAHRGIRLAGRLDAAMARYGGHEAAEDAEIDPELEKSLRALGYF